MLSDQKVSALLTQIPSEVSSEFRDVYVLDFLNLLHRHSEKDLQKDIVQNLKDFIMEFGRDLPLWVKNTGFR